MNFAYYIINSPFLWIVRGYIAMFHMVFILIELDVAIPIVRHVNTTLDSFLHKGFLVQFIGLLDLVMNSNKSSLVETVTDLGVEGLSSRTINLRCAYAVLGISSRGLAACGFVYILLGLAGHTAESRRRVVLQARGREAVVGLAKRTPQRKRGFSSF